MHPDAQGKPCVIANCQAGWAIMAMGAIHPDLMGPMIIAGSPLSYWAGVKGQNPMRYTGGLSGGTWLTALSSDLGNGRFDGSLLVENFEKLNPSHTYWSKPYNLYSRIDTEEERYLEFEKWWSGFFLMNGEEIQAITDELFVGNKLSTGQIVTKDGQRVDLRNIRSPILVFASFGDNITPPQQALGWILDLYDSVDDIRSREQTIIYNLHHDIGHLGIFVSGKIARKETAEFVENIDLVDLLPPGLYELIIEPKRSDTVEGDLIVGNYVTRFERRTLDDIRAFGVNDEEDDLRFATVARVSEINLGLYDLFLRPWVRAMTTEASAEAMRRMSSHRSKYYMLSDLNPAMQVVKTMAGSVRANRRPVPDDNPYLKAQKQISEQIVKSLDAWRDMRDAASEAVFMNTYGSPVLQALVGLHRPGAEARPKRIRDEAHEALVRMRIEDIKSRVEEGGSLEALIRIMIHVRESGRSVDERGFQMLRRIGREHREGEGVSLDRFREILKEQVFLMELDRERALAALPKLVPTAPLRRTVVEAAQQLLDVHGKPHPDEIARLHQVMQLLGLETEPHSREKEPGRVPPPPSRLKSPNGSKAMTADKFEGMIRPEDLRQITEDKEMAELRQALEHKKKVEAEQKDVYQAFLNQHVHPEAKARVTAAVRRAAERGEKELQVTAVLQRVLYGQRTVDQQFRAGLARNTDRLRQGGLRGLGRASASPRLQAEGSDPELSQRHARRRRHDPVLVTRASGGCRLWWPPPVQGLPR